MKHHSATRKLGRKTGPRQALLRGLTRDLIKHGRITTTLAKAKELRPFAEKLVTIARKNTLAANRILISRLGGVEVVGKLCQEIAPKYVDRNGGYTRIVKLAPRQGDGSPEAIIEFV